MDCREIRSGNIGFKVFAVVQARDEGGMALDEEQSFVCALWVQSFLDGHVRLHCTLELPFPTRGFLT